MTELRPSIPLPIISTVPESSWELISNNPLSPPGTTGSQVYSVPLASGKKALVTIGRQRLPDTNEYSMGITISIDGYAVSWEASRTDGKNSVFDESLTLQSPDGIADYKMHNINGDIRYAVHYTGSQQAESLKRTDFSALIPGIVPEEFQDWAANLKQSLPRAPAERSDFIKDTADNISQTRIINVVSDGICSIKAPVDKHAVPTAYRHGDPLKMMNPLSITPSFDPDTWHKTDAGDSKAVAKLRNDPALSGVLKEELIDSLKTGTQIRIDHVEAPEVCNHLGIKQYSQLNPRRP